MHLCLVLTLLVQLSFFWLLMCLFVACRWRDGRDQARSQLLGNNIWKLTCRQMPISGFDFIKKEGMFYFSYGPWISTQAVKIFGFWTQCWTDWLTEHLSSIVTELWCSVASKKKSFIKMQKNRVRDPASGMWGAFRASTLIRVLLLSSLTFTPRGVRFHIQHASLDLRC